MLKIPHKAKPTPMIYKMGEHDLVHIGPHTYANNGLNVDWWGGEMRLRIGNYCSIADSAAFYLSHGHRIDWITSYPFARGDDYWLAGRTFPDGVVTKGDIEIGSDAWIGNGARILSGVRVGHGAVIGTGAVVTSEVPPYAFVAGNPARIIRYRFSPEIIAELLRIAWWNWPEDQVRRHLDVLLSADVERLRRLVDGAAYRPLPPPLPTPSFAEAEPALPAETAPEPAAAQPPARPPVPAAAAAQPLSAPPSPPPVVTVLAQMQERIRAGKLAEAVDIGEAALAKGVDGVALMMQIIHLHLHLGRNQEAWDLGRRVIDRDPDHADAHFQLGLASMRINRYEEALGHFRHVLERTPENVEALTNLAAVYFGLGFIQDALEQLEKAVKLSPGLVPVWQNYVSILNYDENAPLARVMERHREAGRRIAKAAPKPPASYGNDRSPNRRLRVGYLSGDFFNHPAAHYVEPVLRCHDRENFDIYAYSFITWSDPVTQAFRGHVPNWREVGLLDDNALFRQIQNDRIDILVDLSGHTARNRVLVMARKPAPVTVNWIGYLNSMGMKAFDYALLDPHLLSPDAGKEFVEKPCLLPDTAYCYTPLIGGRAVAPAPFRTNGYFTFGCFNNPAKLSQASLAAWAAILKAVPDSRLLFKYKTYGSPMVQRRVLDAMTGHGIPADRIVFEGFSPLGSFLDSFGAIDVALDSFPYSGVTTTMHTLFMGVPVVTLEGDTPMQRFGRTALTGIDRTDWIARTPDEYVAIALRIVEEVRRDPNLREDIQKRMLASPLMQHERFVRDLEKAYRGMWHRWCASHGHR